MGKQVKSNITNFEKDPETGGKSLSTCAEWNDTPANRFQRKAPPHAGFFSQQHPLRICYKKAWWEYQLFQKKNSRKAHYPRYTLIWNKNLSKFENEQWHIRRLKKVLLKYIQFLWCGTPLKANRKIPWRKVWRTSSEQPKWYYRLDTVLPVKKFISGTKLRKKLPMKTIKNSKPLSHFTSREPKTYSSGFRRSAFRNHNHPMILAADWPFFRGLIKKKAEKYVWLPSTKHTSIN